MSYTNVTISESYSQDVAELSFAKLKIEKEFYQDKATRLQRVLENIPQAIKDHGHVDLFDHKGTKIMTLIAQSAAEEA